MRVSETHGEPNKRKRPKRRLIIDVLTPGKGPKGEGSFRMTIRADDTTVAPEVLDKWESVCSEIMAIMTRGPGCDGVWT
jgi:hypothetical protein